ncbi:DinB family protein [Pseudomonas tohonis]|uniref:DinB family protein n=1 Tax=Pseudomonas tohonis TaxID=2725477 RepID=UPI0022F07CC6|nr:DinB family protein [Pseudomonas tohonis]
MLTKAFQYKCWADRRALEAIGLIDAARFPESLAFTLQQLNHMVIVEDLFRARLTGAAEPHAATNSDAVPDYPTLKRRLLASGQWYAEAVARLAAADAAQEIGFRFTDGRTGRLSREEMFFHVLNHGTYHRGNIAHALDLVGVAHPADTYTVFVHATEPARRETA